MVTDSKSPHLDLKCRDDKNGQTYIQSKMLSSHSVDIEFENISLEVVTGFIKKRNKRVLKNVSGLFKSGELTAIMGPSGAGKSSLLNALTGFSYDGVSGCVRAEETVWKIVNNSTDLQVLKDFRKKSCYILQDDRLNPLFSVNELMHFAADLKLGSSTPAEAKAILIQKALDTLGLSGTLETRCSKLSGGQRKRLSIAVELVNNPPVIFLDEPTTGLDSLSTLHCIKMLKELADSGRTVVCTIHQPSANIYKMFDQVYILAEGMCVYNGPSKDTVQYLAEFGFKCPVYYNPADYVLDVVNGEYGNFNEYLAEKCLNRSNGQLKTYTPSKVEKSRCTSCNIFSEFYQFRILLKRCFIQQFRDWTVTHLKLLLHLLVGILLGLFFQDVGDDASKSFSNLGYMVVSIVYLCYTALMPAALKFSEELPVLKKENFNNWYKLKTYYAAVICIGIPLQIIYSVVYAAPSYILTGQPIELYRFLLFTLVLASLGLLSDALGHLIGTLLNPINGTFIGAITICTLLMFCGYLVTISHMLYVMQIISYGSYMRFGFEALVLSIYAHGRSSIPCPETKVYCHLRSTKEILKLLSFKPDNFWFNLGIILFQIFIIKIIAFYTLKRKICKLS